METNARRHVPLTTAIITVKDILELVIVFGITNTVRTPITDR